MISLTKFLEYYGLRFFLSLTTLILFVITVLVSLLIAIPLIRGIASESGTIDRSIPSLPTYTATPITESQQKSEVTGKVVPVQKDQNSYESGMNSRSA